MKEFLFAVIGVAVISVVAAFALEGFQRPVDSAFAGGSTRIDLPGAKPKG